MKMTRRRILGASLLAACTPGSWAADAFPSKPVKLVVPQTPGGASDAIARLVAQALSERWHQSVVVENKAGAGGNVGMEAVLAAPADGHTLLMSYVGTQAINGALYRKLNFDPGRDFVPTASLATVPFVLVARPDAPFATVGEFIAHARKTGATHGSAGNGSVNHLLGEMFNAAARLKLSHIPYRGAAPALQDLMGKRIDVVFTSLPSVAGSIRGQLVKPIALTSRKRAPGFAELPTIAESGLPQFDVNPWFGLMTAKGTPPDVVARLNADANAVLALPALQEKLAQQGATPYPTSPAEFQQVLDTDVRKWAAVVKASGAQLD